MITITDYENYMKILGQSQKQLPIEFDRWDYLKKRLVKHISKRLTIDESGLDDLADVYIGQDWMNYNYFALVSFNWRLIDHEVILDLQKFVRNSKPECIITIGRKLGLECDDLEIAVTAKRIYLAIYKKNEISARELCQNHTVLRRLTTVSERKGVTH